jgi:hypothetical protein
MFKTTRLILAAVMVCFAFIVVNSIPVFAEDEVIFGCYHKRSGFLRIVDEDDTCKHREIPIWWNQSGPQVTEPPVLTIYAPSEYNELSGYTVSAEAYSDSEISHVIIIAPPSGGSAPQSFLYAVPPYTISNPYSAAAGESFDIHVIATDNHGNATKDFVTITRVVLPPDLAATGASSINCLIRNIKVTNLGDTATAASGFYVDFYDTVDPPEIGQISNFCRVLIDHSVAGGETVRIDIENLCPDPVSAVWVQVDTDGQIDESDETNNIAYMFPCE